MKNTILIMILMSFFNGVAQNTGNKKTYCAKCGTTHILADGTGVGMAPPRVYPNPAENIITISSENINNCIDITEFNIIGYEILDQNNVSVMFENIAPTTQYTIDVSNLVSGTYIIKIKLDTLTSNNTIPIQFIKQ